MCIGTCINSWLRSLNTAEHISHVYISVIVYETSRSCFTMTGGIGIWFRRIITWVCPLTWLCWLSWLVWLSSLELSASAIGSSTTFDRSRFDDRDGCSTTWCKCCTGSGSGCDLLRPLNRLLDRVDGFASLTPVLWPLTGEPIISSKSLTVIVLPIDSSDVDWFRRRDAVPLVIGFVCVSIASDFCALPAAAGFARDDLRVALLWICSSFLAGALVVRDVIMVFVFGADRPFDSTTTFFLLVCIVRACCLPDDCCTTTVESAWLKEKRNGTHKDQRFVILIEMRFKSIAFTGWGLLTLGWRCFFCWYSRLSVVIVGATICRILWWWSYRIIFRSSFRWCLEYLIKFSIVIAEPQRGICNQRVLHVIAWWTTISIGEK